MVNRLIASYKIVIKTLKNPILLARTSVVAIAFFLPLSTTLTDILFPVAVFFILLSGNCRENFRAIIDCRVLRLFLILFSLFILGLSYSTASFGESLGILAKYDKLLFGALLLPVLINERWRNIALYAFFSAMMITLMLSYLQVFAKVVLYFGKGHDPASVFKNWIDTNFLMAFFSYLLAWHISREKKFRWIFVIVLLLAVFDTLFLSRGRSGYVVFGALLFLFCWQHFNYKGLFFAIFLLSFLFISAFSFSEAFRNRTNYVVQNVSLYQHGDLDTSVGLRISFVKNSINLVKKHPIFGTGTGSFRHEYYKIVTDEALRISNPHNEYLNITVQLGVIGLVVLLYLFFVHWRDSYLLPKDMRYLAQAVVLSIAVGSLANSWLRDTAEGHFYVYFTALAFSSLYSRRKAIENK